jgi:hypothetical protein
MPKSTPRRPSRNFSMTLHEAIEAMHEIFAAAPDVAQYMNDEAKSRGVPFEHEMYEAIALSYHVHRIPMPPELREYLTQHATEIDPKIRAILPKPLVN